MNYRVKESLKKLVFRIGSKVFDPLDHGATRGQTTTLRAGAPKEIRLLCDRDAKITVSGGVRLGRKLLKNGFSHSYTLFNLFTVRHSEPERIDGMVVANWPQRFFTFGDFLISYLPQLSLILDHVDEKAIYLCDPHVDKPFVGDFLSLIPDREIKTIRPRSIVASSVAFHEKGATFADYSPSMRAINSVRERFGHLLLNHDPNCNIFILRGDSYRQASNQMPEKFRSFLDQHNFTLIDPGESSAEEQISLFSKANIVCGVHGGGFANAIWSSDQAKVIEVFHPKYEFSCFRDLCQKRGIFHRSIGGKGLRYDMRFRESPVQVPWEELESAILSQIS